MLLKWTAATSLSADVPPGQATSTEDDASPRPRQLRRHRQRGRAAKRLTPSVARTRRPRIRVACSWSSLEALGNESFSRCPTKALEREVPRHPKVLRRRPKLSVSTSTARFASPPVTRVLALLLGQHLQLCHSSASYKGSKPSSLTFLFDFKEPRPEL